MADPAADPAADFDLYSSFIPSLHKPAALLPIAEYRRNLLYVVETFPVTIIVAETGSGKTTQIPQFLEKGGWCADGKMIGITQPRRIAATTVAVRVAEEFGCEVGKQVGYTIRFEDMSSPETRIKYLTDGMLVREALSDPLLSRYSVIMVDEAHERSISTDILLGLLKKIQRKRPDLRVIVSSATLQADHFLAYFKRRPEPGREPAPSEADQHAIALTCSGWTYPIEFWHLPCSVENYVTKAVETVFDIHAQGGDGDILVFLTGRDEIESAVAAVLERPTELESGGKTLMPMPLYAGLTSEQQMYIFDKTPPDMRKVVFTTNIAEASVTIDGVVFVIDCGFVKLKVYNPNTGIEALVKTAVSKASAGQRAGRAGRTRPGKCFRLYTEESFDSLAETTPPALQRSNLASTILQLKALGIDNIVRFDYLGPPPSKLVARGLELLHALGSLDEYAKLTKPLGMQMAELALDPMMARTLLAGSEFGCLSEMLTIAAMTSLGGAVWFHHEGEEKKMENGRRRFAVEEGDHITLLNAYHAFVTQGNKAAGFCHKNHLNFKSMTRAVKIRAQLSRQLDRLNIRTDPDTHRTEQDDRPRTEKILRCLTAGYFAHAARMQPDGTFRNVNGSTTLVAHPSSIMFHRKVDWVIFHEAVETGDKTFIRDISTVEKSWLVEAAPNFYQLKTAATGREAGPGLA